MLLLSELQRKVREKVEIGLELALRTSEQRGCVPTVRARAKGNEGRRTLFLKKKAEGGT